MKVELAKIKVSPDRQREVFEDIDKLSESFKIFGQLQNIIIDADFNLIAGERRVRAARQLGWTHIDAKFKHQVTAIEAEEMELEENIQRQDLTYQERARATKRIHDLKQEIHGERSQGKAGAQEQANDKGWSMRNTAAMLGVALGKVSEDVQLATMMELVPEIALEPTKKAAIRKMRVISERMILNELANRAAKSSTGANGDTVQLVNASAADHIRSLADDSVDLVLTDPPYAIDIDQMGGVGWIWNKQMEEVFNDRSDATTKLKEVKFGVWRGPSGFQGFIDIIPDVVRILRPGCHFYIFCAFENFPIYADLFTACGATVRSRPLVWVKNMATFTSFFWKYAGKYEIILCGHKGDSSRVMNGPANDVLEYNTVRDRIHPTEKPVDMLRFIIEQVTSPGELVYDPFAGSGSTLRACRLTKRRGLGCEIDAEMVKKALGLLYAGVKP